MVRHRNLEKVQCECCFDDFEATSIVTCPSRHPFCIQCVQRYADARLGERNTSIECISASGCRLPFHSATLDRILPPKTLKLLGRIIQQKELREANIDNLESCPHCDFAMIVDLDAGFMPLFRCQNVEDGCGKVTCRTCKRDDHRPRTCREEALRCSGAVHTVAEAMSEALMRRCPGCSQPSIKENGCNHLVCPGCRVHFCYHCRKDISREQYAHFHRNVEHDRRSSLGARGKCLLWDETRLEDQHNREVDAARQKAIASQQEVHHIASSRQSQPSQTPILSVDARGELIDLHTLLQAMTEAEVNLKRARSRKYYAERQWRAGKWSEARYLRVVAEVEAYSQELAATQQRYEDGARMDANERPMGIRQHALVGEDAPAANDLHALGVEARQAEQDYRRARGREYNAEKMWVRERHRLWSEERYQGVLAETRAFYDRMIVAQQEYAQAVRAARR